MAVFLYQARDASGQALSGEIEAFDSQAALQDLRGRRILVTALALRDDAPGQSARPSLSSFLSFRWRQRLGRRDLTVFCEQFGNLLDAGVDLLTCLRVLAEQTERRVLRDELPQAAIAIEQGSGLTRALEATGLFPSLFLDTVAAGEVSGSLSPALKSLATHFQKEYDLGRKVTGALTYPVVVFSVVILMTLALSAFVLPQFAELFRASGIPLPMQTRIVLAVGDWTRKFGWLLVLAALGIGAGVGVSWRRRDVRWFVQGVFYRIPLFGPLHHKAELALFCRKYGTLLERGVPLLQALTVCARTTDDLRFSEHLERTRQEVLNGQSFAEAFGKSPLVPRSLYHMLRVGEHSGSIDRSAQRAGEFFEREIESLTTVLTSLVEPVVVLVVAALASVVVSAVALPMFNISQVIH